MASQNNTGLQFDLQHAITIVATAPVAANRFAAYDGGHATSAGGPKDAQAISQFAADPGQAFSAITSYSGLVEASAAIAFGDYVKPAADGSGRAAVGAADDHCGRALGAAAGAGALFECQLVPHRHPAA